MNEQSFCLLVVKTMLTLTIVAIVIWLCISRANCHLQEHFIACQIRQNVWFK